MATQDSERAETGNLTTAVAEVEVGATPHSRRAFSVTEFCLGYGIGRTIAYQEIAAGRLRAVKVGRRTLITRDAAEGWLAALPDLNKPSRNGS